MPSALQQKLEQLPEMFTGNVSGNVSGNVFQKPFRKHVLVKFSGIFARNLARKAFWKSCQKASESDIFRERCPEKFPGKCFGARSQKSLPNSLQKDIQRETCGLAPVARGTPSIRASRQSPNPSPQESQSLPDDLGEGPCSRQGRRLFFPLSFISCFVFCFEHLL